MKILRRNWDRISTRRRLGVPLSVLALLLLVTVGWQLMPNKAEARAPTHLVTIYDDGITRSLPTAVATVRDLLDKAGIKVSDSDLVEPSLDTPILEDSFNINIYRARPVLIIDGDKRLVKLTAYQSPKQIAQAAGLEIHEEDAFRLSTIDNFVSEGLVGEQLVVVPSKEVHVNLYGTDIVVHSQATTVGEMLKDRHISFDSKDTLNPSADTALVNGLQIYIARLGTKIETKEEAIDFTTDTISDSNMFVSQSRVETKGVAGKKIVTYEIITTNGQESKRTKLQEVVVVDPIKQVVVKGTKPIELRSNVAEDKQKIMAAAGLPQSDWAGADYIISHESGWCATKWQGSHSCPTEFIPGGGGPGYGLCQSTPGSKMASAGADWQTNPITQLNWCTGYARARYGGWPQAYAHWLTYHSW